MDRSRDNKRTISRVDGGVCAAIQRATRREQGQSRGSLSEEKLLEIDSKEASLDCWEGSASVESESQIALEPPVTHPSRLSIDALTAQIEAGDMRVSVTHDEVVREAQLESRLGTVIYPSAMDVLEERRFGLVGKSDWTGGWPRQLRQPQHSCWINRIGLVGERSGHRHTGLSRERRISRKSTGKRTRVTSLTLI